MVRSAIEQTAYAVRRLVRSSAIVAFGLLLVVTASRAAAAEPAPLRVMTFNIRYGTANDGPNSWPHRRELVVELLRAEQPHVLGLQEALRFQLDEILEALPDYGEVGVGRDDGKEAGEYAAILYDRRRLTPLEQGTFWFAETPTEPGSLTWGSTFPRICSWMRVKDKHPGGRPFYVFNVHWDHQSQHSREKSADMLAARITGRAQASDPVIVTGDFNADEANAAYLRLVGTRLSALRDTYRVLHPDDQAVATFHAFQGATEGGKIDAVLATPDWHVTHAAILRFEREGVYPSDHYPVTATLRLDDGP